MIGSEKPNETRSEWYNGYKPAAVPWKGSGGAGLPPLSLDQTEARKAEKKCFGDPSPLSLSEGLDPPL